MSAQQVERCAHEKGCTHRRGQHVEKRGSMPAYCSMCKPRNNPTHVFTPASEAVKS